MTVHIEGDPTDARASALRLSFTVTDRRADEQREYEYPVRLEYTECTFGGGKAVVSVFGGRRR